MEEYGQGKRMKEMIYSPRGERDSTIISAPSSTKNQEKKRDPEAHQTKNGKNWYFGYKAHIGVDKNPREKNILSIVRNEIDKYLKETK